MVIQLWSYNYDPEPQGIGPLSGVLARGLASRGHEVLVVAAHPHYPEPCWGLRIRPYRQCHSGITVLRLPLWPGRKSRVARLRQEASYVASLSVTAPLLPPADVVIAVTPSFPALAAAAAFSIVHRTPWVMWLQDIVTDGALTTDQLQEGLLLDGARHLEQVSYTLASKIVVISEAFRHNLLEKGVPAAKIERIFNPSTSDGGDTNDTGLATTHPCKILAMGNIGHSQGLEDIVEAFELDGDLTALGALLVIAGSGVASGAVRSRISTDRVLMPGLLHGDQLVGELRSASLGLVSQRGDIAEFNLPSKLMNYMAWGIPVLASVNPGSETARLVRESRSGWVTDASDPAAFAVKAGELLRSPIELRNAGLAGRAFAKANFAPTSVTDRFENVLESVIH